MSFNIQSFFFEFTFNDFKNHTPPNTIIIYLYPLLSLYETYPSFSFLTMEPFVTSLVHSQLPLISTLLSRSIETYCNAKTSLRDCENLTKYTPSRLPDNKASPSITDKKGFLNHGLFLKFSN